MTTPLQPNSDNAALWEARYQSGDTGWDKGVHHPTLPMLLQQGWLKGRVLNPGCGKGHDVQAIAAGGDQCIATGFDIAATAIDIAEKKRQFANEFYRETSFFTAPEDEDDRFDCIWEHTCFCAIHPEQRERYMASAKTWLKPEGQLVGVFYLSTKNKGNGPPFKISLDDLRTALHTQFEILDERPVEHTYAGRKGEEILIRARPHRESH